MVRPTTSSTKQTLVPKPATSSASPQSMSLPKKLGIGLIIGAALGALAPMALWNPSVTITVGRRPSFSQVAFNVFKFWIKMGLIQDVLLTRAPKYVVQKLAPGKETLLDSRAAKVARIAFMSVLYLSDFKQSISAFYSKSLTYRPNDIFHIAHLARRIGISAIKETGAGAVGALGGVCGSILSSQLI